MHVVIDSERELLATKYLRTNGYNCLGRLCTCMRYSHVMITAGGPCPHGTDE
jgi:hypothetical protein